MCVRSSGVVDAGSLSHGEFWVLRRELGSCGSSPNAFNHWAFWPPRLNVETVGTLKLFCYHVSLAKVTFVDLEELWGILSTISCFEEKVHQRWNRGVSERRKAGRSKIHVSNTFSDLSGQVSHKRVLGVMESFALRYIYSKAHIGNAARQVQLIFIKMVMNTVYRWIDSK